MVQRKAVAFHIFGYPLAEKETNHRLSTGILQLTYHKSLTPGVTTSRSHMVMPFTQEAYSTQLNPTEEVGRPFMFNSMVFGSENKATQMCLQQWRCLKHHLDYVVI